MTRRHVMTLPVHLRPDKTLFARVDPTGLIPGELQIDTDGVVFVSPGVSDTDAMLGVIHYTSATYQELVGLLRSS